MGWQGAETARTGSKHQCELIGRKAGEGQSSAQRPRLLRLPEAKEVETTGAGGLGARAEREGWGGSWGG